MTFQAERIDRAVEFVASTDNWFRPVNFANAPDGTLHVLDMYRETIEHPWSIPDDIKKALDLESGRDRGRIYRLTPPGFTMAKPPRLGSASVAELVAALEHPNAWWRETASRLIYERQDRSYVDPLRTLLRRRTADPPTGPPTASLARLHALWSLHGLGALGEDDLLDGPRRPCRWSSRARRPPGGGATGRFAGPSKASAGAGRRSRSSRAGPGGAVSRRPRRGSGDHRGRGRSRGGTLPTRGYVWPC